MKKKHGRQKRTIVQRIIVSIVRLFNKDFGKTNTLEIREKKRIQQLKNMEKLVEYELEKNKYHSMRKYTLRR